MNLSQGSRRWRIQTLEFIKLVRYEIKGEDIVPYYFYCLWILDYILILLYYVISRSVSLTVNHSQVIYKNDRHNKAWDVSREIIEEKWKFEKEEKEVYPENLYPEKLNFYGEGTDNDGEIDGWIKRDENNETHR